MAYNKSTSYGDSENIHDSEIGLVTKTVLADKANATEIDGRKVFKAGSLYDDATDKYVKVTPVLDKYTEVESPVADSYTEYNTSSGDNPKALNLFERSGAGTEQSPYTYAQTTDTSVDAQTTYYSKTAGDNPIAKGWYTRSGTEGAYTYSAANTSYVAADTTYYAKTPGDNPKAMGWYELSDTTYSASTDTSVDSSKNYYEKVREASEMYGIVLQDYDVTDYDEKPISIVVAGRLKASKCSSAAVSAKSTLAGKGIYLV